MEKIQITKEQDKAIKFLLERRNEWNEERLIRYHANRNDKWVSPSLQCLNDLTLNDMCLRLYAPNSYEVIPQFKLKEWVVNIHSGEIGQVEAFTNVKGALGNSERVVVNNVVNYPDSLRHATPEEIQQEKKRRFWSKLGREVDEWKEGDIVSVDDGAISTIEKGDVKRNKVYFECRPGYYPIDKLRLAVPVEQRLDK